MNVKVFSSKLLNELTAEARQSERKRQHVNIHQSYEDGVQRLFNAIGVDSYIRPHRHSLDPKTESLLGIRGRFALVVFDELGTPVQVTVFGSQADQTDIALGVELSPGAWHTVVALEEGAVLLEIKAGPFDPGAAKEFAPWSPEEGSPEASRFFAALLRSIEEWAPVGA